jgi:hypothetical protein
LCKSYLFSELQLIASSALMPFRLVGHLQLKGFCP